jgi:hypothetical protein
VLSVMKCLGCGAILEEGPSETDGWLVVIQMGGTDALHPSENERP